MPVQPTYPGVYIEEVPSGVHTITGVATSIAAFFGRTSKGPINKAVRVLSLADFERNFGKPHPISDLGFSVRQFFTNGGSDCYVVRLAHQGRKASLNLESIHNRNVLVLTAKTAGDWGNGLRIEVDYNTANPDDTFNLTLIHEEGGKVVSRETHTALSMDPASPRFAPTFVSQSSNLIDAILHTDAATGGASDLKAYDTTADCFAGFSQGGIQVTTPIATFRGIFESILVNTPKFEINVDGTGDVPIDLTNVLGPAPAIPAGSNWNLGPMANRIAAVINEHLDAATTGARVTCFWDSRTVSAVRYSALKITSDSGGPLDADVDSDQRTGVRIRPSASQDFASPMGLGLEQGGVEVARYSGFRPVPTASFFDDTDDLVALGTLDRDDITSIQINGGTAVPFSFASMPAGRWYLDSIGGKDGVREKLRAIVQAANDTAGIDWKAELWGYHLVFTAKDGSNNKIASGVVSAGNAFLGGANFTHNIRRYSLGITGTSAYQIAGVLGTNDGTDGTVPLLNDFVGSETEKTGFHALDDVDIFNLMVIPGDEEIAPADHIRIWGPASTYCAKHRAFLLMDAPTTWTTNGLPTVKSNTSLINTLRIGVVKENAAVFYPRLKYNKDGLTSTIGASGAVAGLMGRIDANRGVWKAPAGIEADLRAVSGLDVKLTDMENGVLNKKGVNCLRIFPGGVINWGARTLFGDDDFGNEWKYIPVRRLALMIEESLFRGTQWVVFEPNDEPLWANIRLNVGAYMMSLFRQGAFQGTDPKDAFFVKCDKETTTQDDINKGIVNIEVGFAPLKPAEFVIIKIQQMAGEL